MKPPHIVVICPHPVDCAPGQRLKFEQYYASWRAAGFTVDVRPFWDKETWRVLYQPGHRAAKTVGMARACARRLSDWVVASRADLVYLFLEAAPLGPPLFEHALRFTGVPIVYDIDDLVYLPHASKNNSFMRWLRNHEKIATLMQIADEIIVCTSHLKSVAEKLNPHVTNISSTIDTDRYVQRPHRSRTKGVVIGWSGSFSTAPYLHLLDDPLRRLQASDEIEVKVLGDSSFRTERLRLSAQNWRLETEVSDLSEIDIGVYPLPHEEWVLGKSGLKALQYMGLGIPTIAQRIGSNLEIIEDGRNGFLADSDEEWEDILRRLIRDPDLRKTIGEAGRETVVARYSVAANKQAYLDVLKRAMSH